MGQMAYKYLLTGMILQVVYLDILYLGREYLLDTPWFFRRVLVFLGFFLGETFTLDDRNNKKSRQRHIEKEPVQMPSPGYLMAISDYHLKGKRFFFFQASHANPNIRFLFLFSWVCSHGVWSPHFSCENSQNFQLPIFFPATKQLVPNNTAHAFARCAESFQGSYLNGTSLNQSLVAFIQIMGWNEARGVR